MTDAERQSPTPEIDGSEPGFPRVTGEDRDTEAAAAAPARRDRGLGAELPDREMQDSGFYGAGDNHGEGNDNLDRETTPGYQSDKWERGTRIPRG